MKNKVLKKLGIFTFIFFTSFWLIGKTTVVFAETDTNNLPKIQYTLEYPANQNPDTKGFYKLAMKPEQQQTINMKMVNNTNKPVRIEIINTNAFTTQNGGINYTDSKESDLSYILDKSFLASQYIQVQNNIELAAHGKKNIPIKIKAPQKSGTYLSGILFTSQQNREKDHKNKVQINSEVRVGTAIQLDVGKREIPEMDIKESITKVYPSGIQIQTRVENATPSIIKTYEIQYKVYNEQNQLMFEGGSKQFDMAPLTGIMFPANWNNKKIASGKYWIEFTVKGEGNTFSKKNEFEVKDTDITIYKNTNVMSDNKPIVENDNHILIYSLFGVIIALIVYILFEKRKRKNSKNTSL